jgi:hypothetical protein
MPRSQFEKANGGDDLHAIRRNQNVMRRALQTSDMTTVTTFGFGTSISGLGSSY